jgi:hypothetical protein
MGIETEGFNFFKKYQNLSYVKNSSLKPQAGYDFLITQKIELSIYKLNQKESPEQFSVSRSSY